MSVMEEVHLTTIKPRNHVLLLAQEISFAKILACNDKRLRDRGLKRLKKWFMVRSQGSVDFSRDDHMRIWKGLFYCMWMSDKPLIQEDLAEEISNLIHSFATFKASLLFVETFFTSLSVEWFGIDQLRLDKFMMLVRRFIRQSFELVARIGWPEKQVQQLADVYYKTLNTAPMGLSMHIIEVFCEELAKVGKGELSNDTILQLITPFARVMATLKDGRFISHITRYIFLHLIRQTELGIEHQMKFSAWKELGFPGGDIDAAEKIEIESECEEEDVNGESEEEGEEDLEREVGTDARAGNVDVLLPPLDFDPKDLLQVLRELRNKKETTTKARKTLIQLITKFEHLADGKYPLGLHKVDLPDKVDKKKEIAKAAKNLYIEEQQLIHSESETEGDGMSWTKKATKKKKVAKQKRFVWKVSEIDNRDHNEFESNTSWEVSESISKDSVKPNLSKKRKLDEKEHSDVGTVNSKINKTKLSSFSVSDSKENSFSSPVKNTSRKRKTNDVLKRTSDNQIRPEENNRIAPKVASNKTVKKLNKKNKNNHSKVGTSNSTLVTKCEEGESTRNNTEENKSVSTELQLNASTIENNNGWGGDWDDPFKDVEYEIFIPNKKYVQKRKSLGLPYPESFIQKLAENVTPVNKLKNVVQNQSTTPNSQKKVEFNLNANCAQDYKEYTQQVKSSKKHVPFDATKKPVQGLLKNSTPSPINPFYKKKLNFLASPKSV